MRENQICAKSMSWFCVKSDRILSNLFNLAFLPLKHLKNSCQKHYDKFSKISNTFVFNAGIHKMLGRIANRENPDQTVLPDLGFSYQQAKC